MFRHPGIRSRFTYWNGTQQLPIAQLKFRSDRCERNIELEILPGKIIGKLGANRIKIAMLAWDDVRLQASAKNCQFAFQCAPIDEFKQAESFVVSDGKHGTKWSFDSLGE